MAYPFRSETQALRRQLLIAIGSGGILGMSVGAVGCSATHEPGQRQKPAAQQMGGSGGRGKAGSGAGSGSGTEAGAAAKGGTGTEGGAGTSAMCGQWHERRECYTRETMEGKARFGCGQIAQKPVPTADEIKAAFLPNGCLPKAITCDGCCQPAAAEGVPQGDGSCCYTYCVRSCCGRPLNVDGESRVAGVAPRADWLVRAAWDGGESAVVASDSAVRARIAAEWREDARMEHASIASFARFTLELLAFGADSELLELAQRAALDEVEHARLCFALAERYDGRATGPAPLDLAGVAPATTLRAAALAAFVEGCIGETQAALVARAARALATDDAVRNVLDRIADDEARHAELAFRFVSFAVRREPELRAEIAAALQDALASAEHAIQPASEHEPTELRDALHGAGRLTSAERAAAMRAALTEVIAPCTRALLGPGCESPPLPTEISSPDLTTGAHSDR